MAPLHPPLLAPFMLLSRLISSCYLIVVGSSAEGMFCSWAGKSDDPLSVMDKSRCDSRKCWTSPACCWSNSVSTTTARLRRRNPNWSSSRQCWKCECDIFTCDTSRQLNTHKHTPTQAHRPSIIALRFFRGQLSLAGSSTSTDHLSTPQQGPFIFFMLATQHLFTMKSPSSHLDFNCLFIFFFFFSSPPSFISLVFPSVLLFLHKGIQLECESVRTLSLLHFKGCGFSQHSVQTIRSISKVSSPEQKAGIFQIPLIKKMHF